MGDAAKSFFPNGAAVWVLSSKHYWPGRICDASDPYVPKTLRSSSSSGRILVLYFGTNNYEWVHPDRAMLYQYMNETHTTGDGPQGDAGAPTGKFAEAFTFGVEQLRSYVDNLLASHPELLSPPKSEDDMDDEDPIVPIAPPPISRVSVQEFHRGLLSVYERVTIRLSRDVSSAIIQPFLWPVKASQVPTYYDTIKHPMDLSTLWQRITRGMYRSRQQFADEVTLIKTNALSFNKPTNCEQPCGCDNCALRSSAILLDGEFAEQLQFLRMEVEGVNLLGIGSNKRHSSAASSSSSSSDEISAPIVTAEACEHECLCFACGEEGALAECSVKSCMKGFHGECTKYKNVDAVPDIFYCPRHQCSEPGCTVVEAGVHPDAAGNGQLLYKCQSCPTALCQTHFEACKDKCGVKFFEALGLKDCILCPSCWIPSANGAAASSSASSFKKQSTSRKPKAKASPSLSNPSESSSSSSSASSSPLVSASSLQSSESAEIPAPDASSATTPSSKTRPASSKRTRSNSLSSAATAPAAASSAAAQQPEQAPENGSSSNGAAPAANKRSRRSSTAATAAASVAAPAAPVAAPAAPITAAPVKIEQKPPSNDLDIAAAVAIAEEKVRAAMQTQLDNAQAMARMRTTSMQEKIAKLEAQVAKLEKQNLFAESQLESEKVALSTVLQILSDSDASDDLVARVHGAVDLLKGSSSA